MTAEFVSAVRTDTFVSAGPLGCADTASAIGPRVRSLRQRRRARQRRAARVRTAIIGAVFVATAAFTLTNFRVAEVPTASMTPTLSVGSDVLIRRTQNLTYGQVAVFTDPGGWLGVSEQGSTPVGAVMDWMTGTNTSSLLVKRVVGLQGDRVSGTTGGHITVNGHVLDEPYVASPKAPSTTAFAVTVPPGCLFVLGDNRADSADSRSHLSHNSGCVPLSGVYGRAIADTTGVTPLHPSGTLARLHQ
jgi:signal peptidase I